jgi:hypothetical protein
MKEVYCYKWTYKLDDKYRYWRLLEASTAAVGTSLQLTGAGYARRFCPAGGCTTTFGAINKG